MPKRSLALRTSIVLLAAVALLTAGCGPSGYSGPTGTVNGKVTLADGKAAPEGCTVTFVSESAAVASGKIGADGTYKLAANGKDQIPAVKYKAFITPPAAPEMSQADYDKVMKGEAAAPAAPAAAVIPALYQSASTSNLSFEVKAGAQTIDIPLK